jgi:hypothetical protein
MSTEAPTGRTAVAFLGVSVAEPAAQGQPVKHATLEEALHDAAEQAGNAYIGKCLRVVDIEFVPGNPHIKELKVIVTPGG